MSKYAKQTTVSPEKSLSEIQKITRKYGAQKFGFIQDEGCVGIAFEMNYRQIRFILPLPSLDKFNLAPSGKVRTPIQSEAAYNQAIRQKWRSLLLAIKAKLESVESGIETFEEAFMAQIVLPNGKTMGEWAAPQIENAYKDKKMPPLLGYQP